LQPDRDLLAIPANTCHNLDVPVGPCFRSEYPHDPLLDLAGVSAVANVTELFTHVSFATPIH
jgi:hypothetical protein